MYYKVFDNPQNPIKFRAIKNAAPVDQSQILRRTSQDFNNFSDQSAQQIFARNFYWEFLLFNNDGDVVSQRIAWEFCINYAPKTNVLEEKANFSSFFTLFSIFSFRGIFGIFGIVSLSIWNVLSNKKIVLRRFMAR